MEYHDGSDAQVLKVGDDRPIAIHELKEYVREEDATRAAGIKKVTLINSYEASDKQRYVGWVDFDMYEAHVVEVV